MECRVNIWLNMKSQAEAEKQADVIHNRMEKAFENNVPFDFWGSDFDSACGEVETYGKSIAINALMTEDVTKDDAIQMYAYFMHACGAETFTMEVESVENCYYAIFKKCGCRLVMQYIPAGHFPEFRKDADGYVCPDVDILCEAFDDYKVTKTIAMDRGFGIYPTR